MRTRVIGVGNAIRRDDGVGIAVVREIVRRCSRCEHPDFIELGAGGFRLMEAMMGYERVVIVDAMRTGTTPPGTIVKFPIQALLPTRNTGCTHDATLATALEAGRLAGADLPRDILIFGIEARHLDGFGEELSADVAKAVPLVVDEITSYLGLSGAGR